MDGELVILVPRSDGIDEFASCGALSMHCQGHAAHGEVLWDIGRVKCLLEGGCGPAHHSDGHHRDHREWDITWEV